MNAKLLGIVAMQKRDETTVELKRLSVRPDARGIGVGKKLVLAVIQVRLNSNNSSVVKNTSSQPLCELLCENILGSTTTVVELC